MYSILPLLRPKTEFEKKDKDQRRYNAKFSKGKSVYLVLKKKTHEVVSGQLIFLSTPLTHFLSLLCKRGVRTRANNPRIKIRMKQDVRKMETLPHLGYMR